MAMSAGKPSIAEAKTGTGRKLEVVQVARGVAALMVVGFHLKGVVPLESLFRKPLDFFFNSGPAGVDLFFILSGFIMVFVTSRSSGGPRSSAVFLAKRLVRIWPLYAIATISYLLINYRYAIPAHLWKGVFQSLAFLPLSTENPPFYGYPFLSVGWSLNYEMYFYLLVAVSLLAGKRRWWLFLVFILSILVVIPVVDGSFSFNEETTGHYRFVYLHMVTNPIIWNFVFGVLIGLAYTTPPVNDFFGRIFSNGLITASLIALVVYQYLWQKWGGHGPLEWGLGMAVAFFAVLFYDQAKSIAYPAWLVYLGDISYSLYLWHLPVLAGVKFALYKLSLDEYGNSLVAFAIMIVLTFFFSHLSYQYLEKRFVLKKH